MSPLEIRRVQVTGGSSFVVTLPKEWIKTLHIKKNDPLGLFMQSDGTLLITPKMTQEQTQRVKEFEITDQTQTSYLLRRLVGAYIAGYSLIKIKSKHRLNSNIRDLIRTFTQTTIGQEVVEETDTSITLKDLLNPTEMPMNRTIKRMYIIVKSMHEDAMQAWESADRSLLEEIITRDNDVDRLHWLVARQHNIILRNVSLAEKMTLTTEMSQTCFLISRITERIGDHVVRISYNLLDILDGTINDELKDHIRSASEQSLDIFNRSITAFLRKDITAANETIEQVHNLAETCERVSAMALKETGKQAICIGYVIESIRRISEYAGDISENVINYLVSEKPSGKTS